MTTKRTHEELKKQLSELERIFNLSLDMIGEGNLDGYFTTINSSFGQLLGYTDKEFLAVPFLEFVHPEDLGKTKKALESTAKGKTKIIIENRYKCKDGSYKWIDWRVLAVPEQNRFIAIGRDVTKQKKAERDLLESRERFHGIYAHSPVGIELFDNEGILVDANAAVLEIFGISDASAVRGFNLFEDPNLPADLKKELFKGKTIHHEMTFDFDIVRKKNLYPTTKTGIIHLDLYITPFISTDKKNHFGYVVQVRDITEKKRVEFELQEREQKFHDLFDSMAQGVFYQLPDGSYVDINQSALKMFGLTRNQFLDRNVFDPAWKIVKEDGSFLPPEERPSMVALRTGRPIRDRVLGAFNPKTEDYTWIVVNALPQFTIGSETPSQVFVTMHDITELRKTEKALQELNSNLNRQLQFNEALMDSIPTPVFYKDTAGNYLGCNRAFIELIDITSKDFIGKKVDEVWPGHEAEIYRERDMELLRNQCRQVYESTITTKNNDTRNALFSKNVFFDEKGQVAGIVGSFLDITERKKIETALIESERKFRAIVETTQDWIWSLNREGLHTYSNDAIKNILGRDRMDILNKPAFDFLHPEDIPLAQKTIKESLQKKQGWDSLVLRWQHKNGSYRSLESCASPILGSDGEIKGWYGVDRDITEKEQAEKAIKESHKRLITILNSLDAIVYVADMETFELLFINKFIEDKFGDVTGRICWQTLQKNQDGPCDFCTNKHLLDGNGNPNGVYSWEFQNTITGQWLNIRDRAIRWVDGRIVRLEIATDITQRKQMEIELQAAKGQLEKKVEQRTLELQKTYGQLLHAEKLSAIGRLSASIAHEFNNPLFGVMNVLSGIRPKVSADKNDLELVEMALDECNRMRGLILDLQSFNRPTSGKIAPTDINKLIDNITKLFAKELAKKKLTIKKQYAADLPLIEAVADQIMQVLLNLITNACDACDEGDSITVTTRKNNGNITLAIKDSGKGITQEVMEHIFEPFFTTKPEVKGTGLGLSVSFGIIRSHNGSIDVKSKPGKGSTFTITLPIGKT